MSPASYIERIKDDEYMELIEERERLLKFIRWYEEQDKAGDRSGEEWNYNPRPDVRYQAYLGHLSELCSLMQEKYNHDYVLSDRKLRDDAKRI